MDKNQWMKTYKQLETERYSKEAFMNGVLVPELSIPIKMPSDGQRETHAFIQRKTYYFNPDGDGKFIIYYFPSILSQEGEQDVICIRTSGLDKRMDDNWDSDTNKIFPNQLFIQNDVAFEYRIPASSIRVNCLKNQIQKEYSTISGTVTYVQTTEGSNKIPSLSTAFKNVSSIFSQRLGLTTNSWITQKNSANIGSRIVFIPRDNNDFDFKSFGEIPKVLQCHIIWGQTCPSDMECMQLQVTRHVEIAILPKWNDIIMPFSIQNSHILSGIRTEISQVPLWGNKGNLIVNSAKDIEEIDAIVKANANKDLISMISK